MAQVSILENEHSCW